MRAVRGQYRADPDLWRHHLYGSADLADRLSEHELRQFGQGRAARHLRVRQPYAYEFTALPPEDRLQKAVEYGAQIHPQYKTDYENGITIGWHRVPWVLGCFGRWTEEKRKQHYENLCAIDGRIVLAGEHVSHIPAWQEGAVLSSLDAISRLHRRVVAS